MKEYIIEFRSINDEQLRTFNLLGIHILKCQILIERELTDFISKRSWNNKRLGGKEYSFTKRLDIARMFGAFALGEKSELMLNFITNLNNARVEIAHTFNREDKTSVALFNSARALLGERVGKKMKDDFEMITSAVSMVCAMLKIQVKLVHDLGEEAAKGVIPPLGNK